MNKRYYRIAKEASSQIGNHPGLIYLQKLAHKSSQILDLGCGEGTRLSTLLRATQKGTGIDINSFAISKAKSNYSKHAFLKYSGAVLPFPNATFDLVYSAFVLEHTTDPKLFLSEAIRVVKKDGFL